MNELESVKNEIKVRKISLALLDKERTETCYTKNKEAIERKKDKLLAEIKSLQESIQSQNGLEVIK